MVRRRCFFATLVGGRCSTVSTLHPVWTHSSVPTLPILFDYSHSVQGVTTGRLRFTFSLQSLVKVCRHSTRFVCHWYDTSSLYVQDQRPSGVWVEVRLPKLPGFSSSALFLNRITCLWARGSKFFPRA